MANRLSSSLAATALVAASFAAAPARAENTWACEHPGSPLGSGTLER